MKLISKMISNDYTIFLNLTYERDIMKNLHHKIRKIRTEQNRTLEDIAEKCGVSKSFLSKVETGKTVPAVATLVKIAEALGVKVSVLLDDEFYTGTIYTPTEKVVTSNMVQTNEGYMFFPIAAERSDKFMQPFIFTAKKGDIQPHCLTHKGEEFIYILEGELKYWVGEKEFILKKGDSLYFDSHEKHRFNPISEEVKYMAVFTK
jgi:transcriptional regulator with XRE-family HTH domain